MLISGCYGRLCSADYGVVLVQFMLSLISDDGVISET